MKRRKWSSMMLESRNLKHDRTDDKEEHPMESIGTDSRFKHGFINKQRKRDIKKLFFPEVEGVRNDKEPKTKMAIGELSLDVSSSGTSLSSCGSSDDGGKPIGLRLSGEVGGGGEEGRSFARPSQSSISVIGPP